MVDNLTQDLLTLEHRGWQALCDGTGAEFYGAVMTNEAVMILAHGQQLDRAAVVESLRYAPTWDSYAITEATVVTLGSDLVIVRYTGTGRRTNEPDFVALMASIYQRVDNSWKLAHYQQTPVPATSG